MYAHQLKITEVFAPGNTDSQGIPYDECVDWCQQFYPCRARMIATNRRILLLVGSNTAPEQIWSMRHNHYKGHCHLEWQASDDTPSTPTSRGDSQ